MAEPFKNLVSTDAVAGIARAVAAVRPDFDAERFVADASRGLEPLELKARVKHVAGVLRRHLPADWRAAVATLVAALPPPLPRDTEVSAGFFLWPLLQVVEDHGAEDPEASLPALREMTRRFSAEFAIRPLLRQHPAKTAAALDAWVDDPDPHVRRLVSEGTRPRLPWGQRLPASILDPRPGLARIERLLDDPSDYVRRSVANHLGDVAKDHPDLAVATARRWLERPARLPLVRHGLRDLLKKGHPDALALFGAGASLEVLEMACPKAVKVGEPIEMVARLRALSQGEGRVDVVWRWPGARGWSSKVFVGETRSLMPGETWDFRWRLSTRPVTTRPTRLGDHQLLLRVNGGDQAPLGFVLYG